MTKYIFGFIILFSFPILNAQKISFTDYQYLSKPDSTNVISQYFKKNIADTLLQKAKFYKNSTVITAKFYVNNHKKIYSVNLSAKYSELNNEIYKLLFHRFTKESFYDLKPDCYYGMQLISKKSDKIFFNCSTKPIELTSPICGDCSQEILYFDKLTCTNEKVKEHFFDNFNFNLFNNRKYIQLNVKYIIDEIGNLKIIPSSNEDQIIFEEKEKILKSFPLKIKPATLNASYKTSTQHFSISFDEKFYPKTYKYNSKLTDSIAENQDLLSYLKSHLTTKDIREAELSYFQPNLRVTFDIDNNGKIYNPHNNSRDIFLSYRINKLIKNAPIDILKLIDNHNIDKASLNILCYKNKKTIINPNPIVIIHQNPTILGCEKELTTRDRKHCSEQTIHESIAQNFKSTKLEKLNLKPGKHRFLSTLQIQENGTFKFLYSDAKHSELEEETKRIIKLIPKFNHSALRQGKPYKSIFSLPISFMVE